MGLWGGDRQPTSVWSLYWTYHKSICTAVPHCFPPIPFNNLHSFHWSFEAKAVHTGITDFLTVCHLSVSLTTNKRNFSRGGSSRCRTACSWRSLVIWGAPSALIPGGRIWFPECIYLLCLPL